MAEETVSETRNRPLPLRLLLFGIKLPLVLIVLLIIGAAAATAYGVTQKPEVLGLSNDPNAKAAAEVQSIITEVGKLIDLPANEQPVLATVADTEKLKDQPFFRKAVNGDKVLIYGSDKRAILYRPSEKRILEVGAININQAVPSPSPSPEGESTTPEESASPEPTESPTPEPEATPQE
jgi:hypothetical protein